MKRTLALLLCALMLISLLPARTGMIAAAEGVTAILKVPDDLTHGKWVQPELEYYNPFEDVDICITYRSVTGEGLVFDNTCDELQENNKIPKGTQQGLYLYSYLISQDVQSDAIDIVATVTVTPDGGAPFDLVCKVSLPVNHAMACTADPDGETHSLACACGRTEAALPHDWEAQKSESGLDGQFAHHLHCAACGVSRLALCALEAQEVVPPTCIDKGYTTCICTVCGRTKQMELTEPTGLHLYGGWLPDKGNTQERANHTRICTNCSDSQTNACSFEGGIVTDPTCEAAGFTSYSCAECSFHYLSDMTERLEHQHAGWQAVESSYPATPRHVGICTRCRDVTEEICLFGDKQVIGPTCAQAGYTRFTCQACAHPLIVEETDKLPHLWGSWHPLEADPGIHQRSCTGCDEVQDAPCVDGDGVATPPTCSQAGFITYTCTACGHARVEMDGEQLSHAWAAWAPAAGTPGFHSRGCMDCTASEEEACVFDTGVTTPPTCIREGYITRTCTLCKFVHTVPDGEGLEHAWGAWQPVIGKAGYHTRICTSCQTADSKPCAFDGGIKTAATCLQDGYVTYTCRDCERVDAVTEGAALGHAWGAWTTQMGPPIFHTRNCLRCIATASEACRFGSGVPTAPSCLEPGVTTFTCQVCLYAYTEENAEQLPHSWGSWHSLEDKPGTHQRSCTGCDEVQAAPCVDAGVATPPTCSQAGFITYTCTACGHVRVEMNGEQLDHAWAAWVPAAGTSGFHSHGCKNCTASQEEACVFDTEVKTPPTCTREGFITRTCTLCKFVHTVPDGEVLEHAWGAWRPVNGRPGYHTRSCVDCQTTDTKPCAYDDGISTPPSCLQDGYITYTCRDCNHVGAVTEGGALGHVWGDWTTQMGPPVFHARDCLYCSTTASEACQFGPGVPTAPNCSEPGVTTFTCPVCSYTYEVENAEQLPHPWGSWHPLEDKPGAHLRRCTGCDEVQEGKCVYAARVQAPTCTDPGFTVYACSACQHAYRGQAVPPTGKHSLSGWQDTADGQHQRSCSACDFLEAQAHQFSWTPGTGGAHTAHCTLCEATRHTDALTGDITLTYETIHLGESITATWVLTGGLPPYTVTACLVVTTEDGRETRVDMDHLADGSADFMPETSGSAKIVIRFTDSLGAEMPLKKAFSVLPPPTATLSIILPTSVRCGDSVQAVLAPEEASGIPLHWSVDDPELAAIDPSGRFTARAPGLVTVRVWAQDSSGQAASCQVSITRPLLPGDANDDEDINTKDLISVLNFLIHKTPLAAEDNANLAGEQGSPDINIDDLLVLIDVLVGL